MTVLRPAPPDSPRAAWAVRRRVVRRWFLRHRAWLAAGCAAVAVASGLRAARPPAPPLATIVVAAADLPAGAVLSPADVAAARVPPGAVPVGVERTVAAATGRTLNAAVRRGEPLTDARFVGPGLLTAAPPGTVAAPVRVTDAATAGLVRPGDRIDVVAVPPDGAGPAAVVASDVLVLAVPVPGEGVASGDGALVVVATSRAVAAALARAAVGDRLSLTVQPG